MRTAGALSIALTALTLAQRQRNEKDTLAVIFAIGAALALIWFLFEFERESRSRMQEARWSGDRRMRRKVHLGYIGAMLLVTAIVTSLVLPYSSTGQNGTKVTSENPALIPEAGQNDSNPQVPKPAPEIIWTVRRLGAAAPGISGAADFEHNPGVTVRILLKQPIDRPLFTIECSLPCVVSRVQTDDSFAPKALSGDRPNVARVGFSASARLETNHEVIIDIRSRDKRDITILAVNPKTTR